MDVLRLIEEVRQRPALWDTTMGERKRRPYIYGLWQEVAKAVGSDAEKCKQKWKNFRDTYHSEVRRVERQIMRHKLMGKYDPNHDYRSKWAYMEAMSFITKCRRPYKSSGGENECTSSNDENPVSNSTTGIRRSQRRVGESIDNATSSAIGSMDDGEDDDDEDDADMLFEEFQSIATPQAARRLSATLSLTNSLEQTLSNSSVEAPDTKLLMEPSTSTAANGPRKDCCKTATQAHSEDRVHFLEDLEKQEQQLIKSTKHDISRALSHIGDSDYNFLVSFLPHMKKMTDLQNLQFRGRMCDLVLTSLAPNAAQHNSAASLPLQPQLAPNVAQDYSSAPASLPLQPTASIIKVECINNKIQASEHPESPTSQDANAANGNEIDNELEFF
ncbi:uncharacterized protein LOC101889709 [Musca domestica]|uniref:Uncharacterized protein LOC101889709 n=1 Tax=Musca domestica TaxID=7370 RepID=A0A9J7CYH3_MUSDO|nr:uncharacterized protein LOC101889709 [Musca domestica]